jgi:RNA-binding protein YhbY
MEKKLLIVCKNKFKIFKSICVKCEAKALDYRGYQVIIYDHKIQIMSHFRNKKTG